MKKHLYIIFLLIACFSKIGQAQYNKEANIILKAHYIYNFAKLVDWTNKDYKKGEFVIAVYGESKVYKELYRLYNSKSIGTQPISIIRYTNPNDIKKCHILFVPKSHNGALPTIQTSLGNQSTLLITESSGFLKRGSIINFLVKSNKLVYELSHSNAKKKNLIIASQLSQLAENKE